ncbi:zinc-binding alcohol dehydrogenase family protein [Pedobacter miscanthi]|uniref:quinone oxidoreductase family protein n=1 Tax=Pedobacter miscanthi TaxID=2259170 RepID=UPI00292EA3FA|nr:zinc-binding dehydrogenase [Pedobacter miscanthi]
MKAIKINEFGSADVLSFEEVPEPVAVNKQLKIQVEGAAVGAADILLRKGVYPGMTQANFIPGIEAAGTVISVGDQADKQWVGRRVFAITGLGAYAEQVIVDEDMAIIIPDELTVNEALGLGVNALVADYSLHRSGLIQDDHVLIRGAGGGIGSMAVQLAIANSFEVSVIASSPQKKQDLHNLGVRRFLTMDEAKAGTLEFNAVVDPVAGEDIDTFVELLKENGSYLINGVAGGFPFPDFGMSWLKRFQRSLTLSCFSLNSIPPKEIRGRMDKIFNLAKNGKIKPLIGETFPLENAIAAHILLETGISFGKLILINK